MICNQIKHAPILSISKKAKLMASLLDAESLKTGNY